jgi:hypothetical protein
VVNTRCIRNPKWEEACSILERLHREGKNVNVAHNCMIRGARIGVWVSKQRHIYKKSHLSMDAERIARLEAIGFIWNVSDEDLEGGCRGLG